MVFQDVAKRTGGDIYLGIVGPVRTGKSTFIKKFMELIVLPAITDEEIRMRAIDELPQSAAGKTIMTTEPKFVPNQAATIEVAQGITIDCRLVDCVGYAVKEARGYEDEQGPRMVTTPWYDDPIAFEEAAEIGTRKVIADHSTIGIVVTTDGSIAEIAREHYVQAEERVIEELKELGKPFVIVINSMVPYSADTQTLRAVLAQRHDIPTIALSANTMTVEDILLVLREALYEFPVHEVKVNLPSWVMVLEEQHWLRFTMEEAIRNTIQDVRRLRDVNHVVERFLELEFIDRAQLLHLDMGQGIAAVEIDAPDTFYDQVLTEIIGEKLRGKDHLLRLLRDLSLAKREYDKVASAMQMVKVTGYGIAPPVLEEMKLDDPEIIRQGPRFGVRLKATAPSIHMIRVDVESEFAPIVGTEKQSEELVNYLMRDFEENPLKIWESDIFGKSLASIVREGIAAKLSLMPENAQFKLRETLSRIINEGSGGLIAIIL